MKYYDEIAKGYDELYEKEQLKKIAKIKEHITIFESDKLLDVGCGTGISTEPWKCLRYGIDPSPKLIDIAKKKREGEYRIAPAEDIPFLDNEFDIVISITALQNFDDIQKGLSEIKRVGKDKFVLTFLKNSAKKDEIITEVKRIFGNYDLIEEEKDIIVVIK